MLGPYMAGGAGHSQRDGVVRVGLLRLRAALIRRQAGSAATPGYGWIRGGRHKGQRGSHGAIKGLSFPAT